MLLHREAMTASTHLEPSLTLVLGVGDLDQLQDLDWDQDVDLDLLPAAVERLFGDWEPDREREEPVPGGL